MNYLKAYYAIIAKAAGREACILYDKHHIIPQSIGGPDIETNWIYLKPREHMVAHHLLAKAYPTVEKLQNGFNVANLKTYDCYRYIMRVKDLSAMLTETKHRKDVLAKIELLLREIEKFDIDNVIFPVSNKRKTKKKENE